MPGWSGAGSAMLFTNVRARFLLHMSNLFGPPEPDVSVESSLAKKNTRIEEEELYISSLDGVTRG